MDRNIPPTHTVTPIDPPPESDDPTTSMLKADIDSGRTGDKVNVFDPGLSPLGTDDEAAGRPPSAFRVALARQYENAGRWMQGSRKAGYPHQPLDGTLVGFIGFIAAAAVIFVVGLASF